jgi:uncharacterized protein
MRASTLGGIDCDVHPACPGIQALLPYLDASWQQRLNACALGGLDLTSFPPAAPAHARAGWHVADGRVGADPAALLAEALDAFASRAAILNCLSGLAALHDEHLAAALARALNDWIAAEWLDRDPRLAASIVIAPHRPDLAVEEIERCAADRRFVQVLVLVMGDQPLGRRALWPVWAAAERNALPLAIHAGGAGRHATTGNGWPSYHLEDYVTQPLAFQTQLMSLLCEGVFHRFPGLTVVLLESGFTWLPAFLWRLEANAMALAAEFPWMDRPPAELVRERVRVTLQPSDTPPGGRELARMLTALGSERMVLFSTDYPHRQFERHEVFPPGFPAALRQRVLMDNPLETYKRLALTQAVP